MTFDAFEGTHPIKAFFEQIEISIDYRHYTQVMSLVYKGLSQLFEFEGEQYVYNYYFPDKVKKVVYYGVIIRNGKLKELLLLQDPSGLIEVYEDGCKYFETLHNLDKIEKEYPELCSQLH